MLTGKQKRFLRALGHALKPVVTVGKGEISEAVIVETGAALQAHELVKVKLLESCMADRQDVADQLSISCCAEVAQILGRTILLYRQAQTPKLLLPADKAVSTGGKAKQ
jgi:RNA-binding protein